MIGIELTEQEVYGAFLHKERLFREDDLRMALDEAEDRGELDGMHAQGAIADDVLFERMMQCYGRNLDKRGMERLETPC
jgi:hypothetical protein